MFATFKIRRKDSKYLFAMKYLKKPRIPLPEKNIFTEYFKNRNHFIIVIKHYVVPIQSMISTNVIVFKYVSFQGFLVDGFPINMEQASMFVNNLGTPTQSVAFEASDEVLTGRLLARGNFDDTEESIKKRLAYYDTNTRPVIENFNTKIINVEREANEIFAEVEKINWD